MESAIGFVIVAISSLTPNINKYFAIDKTSGGYPWWSDYFPNAEIFKTFDGAKKLLSDKKFFEPVRMSDGTIFPSYEVHKASGVNKENPSAEVAFKICPLILGEPLHRIATKAEIKHPKEVFYEY